MIRWPLVLLRLCASVLLCFGFVHPDEHHQSPQLASKLIFLDSSNCSVPWEYMPNAAIRSVLLPLLSAAPPFAVVRALQSAVLTSPTTSCWWCWSRVLSPRVWLLLCSVFCADRILLSGRLPAFVVSSVISGSERSSIDTASLIVGVPLVLWLFTLSWATLVLLVRPFGNSLEAMIVWLVLYSALDPRQLPSSLLSLRQPSSSPSLDAASSPRTPAATPSLDVSSSTRRRSQVHAPSSSLRSSSPRASRAAASRSPSPQTLLPPQQQPQSQQEQDSSEPSQLSLTWLPATTVGALVALGVWIRFTFIFFAAPILVFLTALWLHAPRPLTVSRIIRALTYYVSLSATLIPCALLFIDLDSRFYASLSSAGQKV